MVIKAHRSFHARNRELSTHVHLCWMFLGAIPPSTNTRSFLGQPVKRFLAEEKIISVWLTLRVGMVTVAIGNRNPD